MAKKRKPKPATPRKPRSPFAGRRQTGAGYHSGKKYGKKERRRARDETEKEEEDTGEK